MDGWTYTGSDNGQPGVWKFQRPGQRLANCPAVQGTPFKWLKTIALPAGKQAALHLEVSSMADNYAPCEFALTVKANGQTLLRRTIVHGTTFVSHDVDLSAFAGQTVNLELWNNMGNGGWHWVLAYWSNVQLKVAGQPASAAQTAPAATAALPILPRSSAEQAQKTPPEIVLPAFASSEKKMQCRPKCSKTGKPGSSRAQRRGQSRQETAAYVRVGNKTEKYGLAGADEKNLLVALQGNALPVSWKKVWPQPTALPSPRRCWKATMTFQACCASPFSC